MSQNDKRNVTLMLSHFLQSSLCFKSIEKYKLTLLSSSCHSHVTEVNDRLFIVFLGFNKKVHTKCFYFSHTTKYWVF